MSPSDTRTTSGTHRRLRPGRMPDGAWALALRAVVGYGMMAHGLAKLTRGPDAFAAVLLALAVPIPHVMAWATVLVELLGGLAVLTGAFVWVASIPMIVVLLVAMFTVHLRYGFSSIKLVAVTSAGPQFGPPGYETVLLYIAGLIALVAGGAGPLSIDEWIAKRPHDRPSTRLRSVLCALQSRLGH